uniref:Nuclear autoantigenic sperm protein n=1 Tax=Kalanchoe fedtschenkoi TaxID=63787 RepID=A0A7N0RBR4_KALFE
MEKKDDVSNEATVAVVETAAPGGPTVTVSTSNSEGSKAEASMATSEAGKTLEDAEELLVKGSKAVKDGDLVGAVDFYSRALEIRVQHYGELAPECVQAYYKYGQALLYKAQEEADPLVSAPNNDAREDNAKGMDAKSSTNGESFITSVSSNAPQDGDSKQPEVLNDSNVRDQESDDDSDEDNLGDGEEDESDLDLAWKMLDIARAIVEKLPGDTMVKVDILSALAEVALEREDIETSLSDYLSALSVLERLVEPDSRLIAELNFRICLCLEIGSKADEAIPYCQKAISICKSLVDRLKNEVNSKPEVGTSATADNVYQRNGQTSETTHSDSATSDKEAEIQTLTDLTSDLEKKLEDLQQLVANPSSVLSEIMQIMAAKGKGNANGASSGASSSRIAVAGSSAKLLHSPTVSTAHTNGAKVTNLGVVGRGVKRVSTDSGNSESKQVKRIAPTPVDKSDGST